MNKKAIRKELAMSLLKGIEEVLNKHNNAASKKIRKTTLDASKQVAKKFVKALKSLPEKEGGIKTAKKTSFPVKTPRAAESKIVRIPEKKIVPLKTKVKK